MPQTAFGLPGHGERGEAGFRILRRQRLDRADRLGDRLGDFLRVPRGPDAGAVDAAAAAS